MCFCGARRCRRRRAFKPAARQRRSRRGAMRRLQRWTRRMRAQRRRRGMMKSSLRGKPQTRCRGAKARRWPSSTPPPPPSPPPKTPPRGTTAPQMRNGGTLCRRCPSLTPPPSAPTPLQRLIATTSRSTPRCDIARAPIGPADPPRPSTSSPTRLSLRAVGCGMDLMLARTSDMCSLRCDRGRTRVSFAGTGPA